MQIHSPINAPTFEELVEKRQRSLDISTKSVLEHANEAKEISELLSRIIHHPIDIADYYKIAVRLSKLLEKMCETGPDSIFAYFYKQINPRQEGTPQYLRAVCIDLYEQMKCLRSHRMEKHGVRLIS